MKRVSIVILMILASSSSWAKPVALGSWLETWAEHYKLNLNSSDLGSSGQSQIDPPQFVKSKDEAVSKMNSVLFGFGLDAMYDRKLDLYRVTWLRDARDQSPPLVIKAEELPGEDTLVTRVFSLRHFPSEAIARTLRSFSPASSRLVPVEMANKLLVTDSARNIRAYEKIVDSLDTPEGAREANEYLKQRHHSEDCAPADTKHKFESSVSVTLLLVLVGLLLGFIVRGYVIRRIEGGL